MYQQALRVALQLIFFRGGPADMPFSLATTRAAAVLSVLATMLLLSPVAPMPLAFATGVGGTLGVAFFTRQLLRGRKLDNRFNQTVAAQLITGSLFALAMWPAFNAMAPAMEKILDTLREAQSVTTPEASEALLQKLSNEARDPEALGVPNWAALWSDALFVWSLVVATRINRLAADLRALPGIVLTLLSLFVLMGFVLMAQIVMSVLFL